MKFKISILNDTLDSLNDILDSLNNDLKDEIGGNDYCPSLVEQNSLNNSNHPVVLAIKIQG